MIRALPLILVLLAPMCRTLALAQSPTRAGCGAAGGVFVPGRGGGTCKAAETSVDPWRPAAPKLPAAPVLANPGTFATTRSLGSGSTIRNMAFNGLSSVTRPRGVNAGVTIQDVQTTGSSHLIRTYTAGDSMPNVTVRRVAMIDNGPGGLRFRGASSGTIADVTIAATRPNTDCSKVPEGIALAGKGATDVGGPWTISRVRITGIKTVGCSFLNGDGLAIERGYRDIVVTDAYFGFNSDAGADVKSPTARLDRVVSEGNRRNYKFWASQDHGTLTSIDPGQPGSGAPAHIQLQGNRAVTRTMHIARLIVRSTNTTPIFQIENGAWDVTVDACDIAVPAGTKMLAGAQALVRASRLTLGIGCR
jgi:hypothetical protein